MKTILVAVLVLGFAAAAHAQQPPTREQCDATVKTLGQIPGKLQAMPIRKLADFEKFAMHCADTYKSYVYSLVDATLSQVIVERYEEFINERELGNIFLAWDAKLYGE